VVLSDRCRGRGVPSGTASMFNTATGVASVASGADDRIARPR
jgi:hypothetical protein